MDKLWTPPGVCIVSCNNCALFIVLRHSCTTIDLVHRAEEMAEVIKRLKELMKEGKMRK